MRRFREERGAGREIGDAVAAAGATASRAVLFSGITVVLALVGMFLVPQTIFRSIAAGAITVVLVSVLAALTLLPAVLAAFGDRVERLRVPLLHRRAGDGLWSRVAALALRRPAISLAAGSRCSSRQGIAVVIAIATIVLLAGRWRSASSSRRLAIAPVLVAGAIVFALLVPWTLNDALDDPLDQWPDLAVQLALASVPVAFLLGLLRTRLVRAGVADLVVELGGPVAPGALRAALARALRDPTLTVAYWLPDGERHVDAEGRPLTLPDGPERAVTEVQRDDRRIAALVHDPALADQPELVASAGAAAALALENERLQAELRARLEQLHASRARLVEAAEGERRRIERDLHDGTQQRLVSIAMTLGLAESRLDDDPAGVGPLLGQARAALSDALSELRELSQGIHPGILTERGLRAALEELAYSARVPLELDADLSERLPDRIEAAAYFVVSEALTNVSKHAQARAVRVAVGHAAGRVYRRGRRRRRRRRRRRSRHWAAQSRRPGRRARRPARRREPGGSRHRAAGGDPVRVILADDSMLLREGLARLLTEAGFEVVGQAADGDELVALVDAERPDAVIVDIRMPPSHTDEGLRPARVIRERWPAVGILVLSQFARPSYAFELLQTGTEGIGYMLKDRVADLADLAALADGVRRVAAGESVLDPSVVE